MRKPISRLFGFGCLVSAATAIGGSGVDTTVQLDGIQSDGAVTASEMQTFQKEASGYKEEFNVNAAAGLYYWRCDAWYVYNISYNYYWISPNLAYARSQALGACQLNFGYNCQYRCDVAY